MSYADAYCWLAATCAATAIMFMPYVMNRIMRHGMINAMGYISEDNPPDWAKRSQSAHNNAIENLVIFAPLVLVAIAVGVDAGLVAKVAMIYFWTRMVHYIVYSAGIPFVRTLSFFLGFGLQIYLAIQIFSVVT